MSLPTDDKFQQPGCSQSVQVKQPPQLVHSSEDLWVVNKPANISLLHDRSTPNNFWQQLQALPGKPYLVHRLDKGTSGVLLIARTPAMQKRLTRAFAGQQVHKYYLARVLGRFPRQQTYTINLPLCKGRKSRYRIAGERNQIQQHHLTFAVPQDRPGVAASTRVRCLHQQAGHSLLLIKPQSGRTHQIRVHLSWLGYPLLGDHLYGKPGDSQQQAQRLMLHCHTLIIDGQRFQAPVPEEFLAHI